MTIVISIALLILTFLVYRHHLQPKNNLLLFILRILVLLILTGILFGEVFQVFWTRPARRVAVLIDRSESMEAIAAGRDIQKAINHLKEILPPKVALEAWVFADSVALSTTAISDFDRPDSAPFGKHRTQLGKALQIVGKRKPGAIIVLSDGQDNGEIDPVAVAENIKVPVYTIGFGVQKERNLTVKELLLPPSVYAFDTVVVKVHLQSQGFPPDARAVIHLEPLGASKEITLSTELSEQEVTFPTTFSSVGYHRLTIKTESIPNELTYLDNSRTATIEVKPSRVQVVYLTNCPSLNTKFILRALKGESRVTVVPIITFTNGFPSNLPNDPSFTRADIFILDGIQSSGLEQEIRNRVETGAGVFIIAKEDSPPNPEMDKLLPFSSFNAHHPIQNKEIYLDLADGAKLFPWFETENIDINTLPPLGTLFTGTPLPHSTTILKTRDEGAPVLVVSKIQKGKVAYFGGSPLWRWGFLPDFPQEKKTPLEILLSGIIRYLADKDTTLSRLETAALTYLAGEPIRFTFTAKHPDGTPWQGLDVNLSLTPGQISLPMIERDVGVYFGELPGLNPGKYTATAIPYASGSTLNASGLRRSVSFEVLPQSVELIRLGMNQSLLTRLAQVTGGWFTPVESLPPSVSASEQNERGNLNRLILKSYRTGFTLNPRGSPWWFIIFALLFGCELLFRRKKGLL